MTERLHDLYQLKRTPFHERTAKLCLPQNWRRWAGYIAAGSYDLNLDREYWAIRNHAALIDISPLMKYVIDGPDAARLLHKLTPRDIYKMSIGQVYYTGWCDDEGKLLDDGTVTRLGEQSFRLTSAEPSLRWLSMNAVGMQVTITELTDRMAALSLQGPKSRLILNRCCESAVDALKYFRMAPNRILGKPVTISRTGYTGDLGYEIWMENERRARDLGCADRERRRLRHRTVRHPRDGHGARRSGPLHARRRLHPGQPCLDRGPEILAV